MHHPDEPEALRTGRSKSFRIPFGSAPSRRLPARVVELEAKLLAGYVRATLDDGAGNVPRIPPYDVGGGFTRMGEVFA